MRIFFFILILFISFNNAHAEEGKTIPRTVIALYEDRGAGIRTSYLHRMAEMPLNHLGLKLEYYDIHQSLPDISERDDVIGVISWFFTDTRMKDPEGYIRWALKNVKAGKKYVVMGSLGIASNDPKILPPSSPLINRFTKHIGFKMLQRWTETTFDVTYDYRNPEMFLSENPYIWIRPSYEAVKAVGNDSIVHLAVHKGNQSETNSDLIITGPGGGYAAADYSFRSNEKDGVEVSQWLINPFEFFRNAFDTDRFPKPDTTTIAGRRIYYSHIDGDGWNNITQLETYRKKPTLSAQVIMDKAIKPYPDLPVTLTVIAADIDPKWVAADQSRDVAKEFFALPQVEAGTHTYSHPFYWQFFQDGNFQQEIPYLRLYPLGAWKTDTYNNILSTKPEANPMPSGYAVPRAFANQPFDIHNEIEGSIKEISTLLPADKKIELLTWSGNCSPWEGALHLAHDVEIQNINGGDSRFDAEYPYYASVTPIGIEVGKERQIYASASNENTYTNLWSANFHAHRYLTHTLKNTESPIRLKPLNIYYHIYAGEKQSSLGALTSNLDYAMSQEIAPITTSHYTKIAEGFYDTNIIDLGNDTWQVKNHGALSTIRFDRHSSKKVDFSNSTGVIGARYFQGSLYVYLDSSIPEPVIALTDHEKSHKLPQENKPYLIESRWIISDVYQQYNSISFTAEGYGSGKMRWQMPAPGNYRISVDDIPHQDITINSRVLTLELKENIFKPKRITITRI